MTAPDTSTYEIAVLFEEARRRREEGNSSGAFARYRRLLDLAEERGDVRGHAELLAEVGDMYQRVCETVPARHWFEKALAAFSAIGDGDAVARVRLSLGEIALVEGSLTGAREHFDAATHASAVEVSALAVAQIGSLLLTQGSELEGLSRLCEAYEALREHPVERETVQRLLQRWARQLTPARFRRLLGRATADAALRTEIERIVL